MSLEVFEVVSSRLQAISDQPQCIFKHCHLLSKRDNSANGPNMPVVFLPQKNTVECERVSRMSSWGFMSFVLAVINGVINVSTITRFIFNSMQLKYIFPYVGVKQH